MPNSPIVLVRVPLQIIYALHPDDVYGIGQVRVKPVQAIST
jgi:hypothetical protein